MTIDFTLRIDTLVSFTVLLLSASAVWGALREDLKTVLADVRELKAAAAKQTDMLIDIARQDQHLKDLDRRIVKLEGVTI